MIHITPHERLATLDLPRRFARILIIDVQIVQIHRSIGWNFILGQLGLVVQVRPVGDMLNDVHCLVQRAHLGKVVESGSKYLEWEGQLRR